MTKSEACSSGLLGLAFSALWFATKRSLAHEGFIRDERQHRLVYDNLMSI